MRGRPLKINDPSSAAKDSASDKIVQATQKIQTGMFCDRHNRLCYEKYDGSCGVYTHDYVLEHAKKLVSSLIPPCSLCFINKPIFQGARTTSCVRKQAP